MSNKKNIVYLYSEVMPYAISVMRSLVNNFEVSVHCVYWDENKKTPFIPANENGINFYKRSGFNTDSLTRFIEEKKPAIIYVSGRMDKLYLEMALHFKKKGVKVVTGCDNQWSGSGKQVIQSAFGKMLFRKYFDYIWIPGSRQYAFAKKMGYTDKKIIPNCYTADTSVFSQAYENNKVAKKQSYPHTIVFVGRFTEVKGIDILTEAFNAAKQKTENDWKLILVGSGNLKFENTPSVEVIDYMSNAGLAEKSKDWGVFCLPSTKEAWGVVVHEFAAAGLPLICSDAVGAGDSFIVKGSNGFTFKAGDKADLEKKLTAIMAMPDKDLFTMGEKSHTISKGINPARSAHSLMSTLLLDLR